jgi:hypothetical protein
MVRQWVVALLLAAFVAGLTGCGSSDTANRPKQTRQLPPGRIPHTGGGAPRPGGGPPGPQGP